MLKCKNSPFRIIGSSRLGRSELQEISEYQLQTERILSVSII